MIGECKVEGRDMKGRGKRNEGERRGEMGEGKGREESSVLSSTL